MHTQEKRPAASLEMLPPLNVLCAFQPSAFIGADATPSTEPSLHTPPPPPPTCLWKALDYLFM